MASFFGKEIPWIPPQLQKNSDFCHLESYLYAIRNNIIEMTSTEMRSLICSIICDRINAANRENNKPIIDIKNLTLNRIESFISENYYNNLYKFGGGESDEYSFPTLFRVLDCFDIQEVKLICKYINEKVFDPNIETSWYHFAYYCRSDFFVDSSSLEVLVNAFAAGISPVYADGKPFPPWTEINQNDWASIDGYNLVIAAGFLFSWNRCKHRLINHNDLYTSCKQLAEEACDLLLYNQNADGSWDYSTVSEGLKCEQRLVPTSFAILALSMCHDEKFSNVLRDAHEWLLSRLEENKFLNDSLYAHYDTVIMDAFLLSDKDKGLGIGKVSFSINPCVLRENAPKLSRAYIEFIHLSDIHFSPEMDNGLSASIRKDLISHIGKMVRSGVKITDLIITGDFRHAKSSVTVDKAIEDAVKYIKELATAAHITNPEHIHLVPGNHDINRKYLNDTVDIDGKPVSYHDLYRNQYFEKKGLLSEEAIKKIGSQLFFFRKIALKIYKNNNPWKNTKIHTYRYVDGTVFLYLNTAIFHQSDTDRRNLIVGVKYIEDILSTITKSYPNAPIVVLAHHSPDYFDLREKIKIEKLFAKYPISLYLCGDAHLPWWRMTNGQLEFTAGCIKDEDGSQAEFLFGNAANYNFTSYIWDDYQGWGEFSAFNSSLDAFLRVMNLKDKND